MRLGDFSEPEPSSVMNRALDNAARLHDPVRLPWLRRLLGGIRHMQGAGHLFQRMASAPDTNQLDDYLSEVVYALVFAGLGFQVAVEPLGRRGPDLEIQRGAHRACVEVTRFRKIHHGPVEIDLSRDDDAEILEYGDVRRDIAKSHTKLTSKLPQLGSSPSIIAIWNDDEDLEEVEVEAAVISFRRTFARGVSTLPGGLLFVLYGSHWVRVGDDKQLYCFPVRAVPEPYRSWQEQLAGSTVRSLIATALTKTALTKIESGEPHDLS